MINTLENPSIKAVFISGEEGFLKLYLLFVNNEHQRIVIRCGKLLVMLLVACDIVTLTTTRVKLYRHSA